MRLAWAQRAQSLMSVIAGRSVEDEASRRNVSAEELSKALDKAYQEVQRRRASDLPRELPANPTPLQIERMRNAFRKLALRKTRTKFLAACVPLSALSASLIFASPQRDFHAGPIDISFELIDFGLLALLAVLLLDLWHSLKLFLALHAHDADTRVSALHSKYRHLPEELRSASATRMELEERIKLADEAIQESNRREGEALGTLRSLSARLEESKRECASLKQKLEDAFQKLGWQQAIEEFDARRILDHGFLDSNRETWRDRVCERHENEVVLFADACGFTLWATAQAPGTIGKAIEQLIENVDSAAGRYGLCRIKIIGDELMLCSKLFAADDLAKKCTNALDFAHLLMNDNRLSLAGLPWKFGVACGPLASAMLMQHGASIDIWGSTVNLAAKIIKCEGKADVVSVCSNTWKAIEHHSVLKKFGPALRHASTLPGLGETEISKLPRELFGAPV